MDLTKLSDKDLQALSTGNIKLVSDAGLNALSGKVAPAPYGVGSELLSGLTFGFGDEIRSKITGEPIEAVRAGQEAYRKANPVASTVANVVGSLPIGGVLGKGVIAAAKGIGSVIPGAKTIAPIIAENAPAILRVPTQAAVIGSTEGAIRGVGEGTGAAQGAITGAIGGVGGGVVSAVASKGARKLAKKDINPLLARVGERARAAGLNENSVIPAGQSLAEQGGRVVQGRLEGPLQRLGGAVYRKSDEASATVPEVFTGRQQAMRQDIPRQIAESLMANPNIKSYIAQKEEAARPLFEQAYMISGMDQARNPIAQMPFNITQPLNQPAGTRAYTAAAEIFGNKGIQPPTFEEVTQGKAPLEFMNEVKKQLQVIYSKPSVENQASGIQADRASLEQLAGRFTGALKGVAPKEYEAALAQSGDAIRMRKAFDLGMESYGKKADEIREIMSMLTPDAAEGFRSGLARAAQDIAQGQNDTASQTLVNRLIGSPRIREGLEVAGANRQSLEAINENARKQTAFEVAMGGNSATALNRGADEALSGDMTNAVQFIKNPITSLGDIIRQGVTSRNADDMSRLLFNFDNPEANQVALKQILEAERRLAQLRSGSAAYGGAGGSALTGGLLGDSQQ